MYLGTDLHKRYVQVVAMDLKGEVIEEVRVKNANLDDLAQRYADSCTVIEATSNYYHIYDTLTEYLDVTVAHPGRLALIVQSDKKTDHVDTKELARLFWLNSVPQSYIPTDEIREARAFVCRRQTLVEDRTKFANKTRGLLTDNGIIRMVKLLSVEGREFLRGLSLPSPWDSLLDPYLDVIGTLTEQMTQLEAAIEERTGSLKETQLLIAVPGVSHYSTLLIYAELSEIDRFSGHKEVMSYIGLNPTIREPGDSRIEGGISKRGSGRVRWILVQSAYSAVYTCRDVYLSTFFHRLNRRMNSEKTIVATARKLLASMYYMLIREEIYDPPRVSAWRRESEERRTDVSRWPDKASTSGSSSKTRSDRLPVVEVLTAALSSGFSSLRD